MPNLARIGAYLKDFYAGPHSEYAIINPPLNAGIASLPYAIPDLFEFLGDSISPPTKYQIFQDGVETAGWIVSDLNDASSIRAAGKIYTVGNEVRDWRYRTGAADKIFQRDEIYLRSDEDGEWGVWNRMSSTISSLAYQQRRNGLLAPEPEMSFSFDSELPEYLVDAKHENYQELSNSFKDAVRSGLQAWSKATGYRFNEVADGEGVIRIGSGTMSNSHFMRYGSKTISSKDDSAAHDLFFNSEQVSFEDVSVGSKGYWKILQGIGSAIGFKAPSSLHDNLMFSVMSNRRGSDFNAFPTQPLIADHQTTAASVIENAGDTVFQWTAENSPWVIRDSSGSDTIDLSNHTLGAVVRLEAGRQSFIGEKSNKLHRWWTSYYGSGIEKAIGGEGNDLITGSGVDNFLAGGKGKDHLRGLQGDDLLDGGLGDDRYFYKLGDEFDTIRESAGGGIDTLHIQSFWALNRLKADVSFEKLGNDLNINLHFNNQTDVSQGRILVREMNDAAKRIESVRLEDGAGNKIGPRVSLVSVWNQLESMGAEAGEFHRFRPTATHDQFGAIAAKV